MTHLVNKLLILTVLWLVTGGSVSATVKLTVNDCPAFCDSAASTLLVSVPQQWFGGSQTVTVQGAGGCQVVSIDGIPLASDGMFTFTDITGNRSWTVQCADGKEYALQLTYLPIVGLDGDFGYDYAPGTMILAEPGQSDSETMTATIKWRGNTTNTPEKHKRNYSIKFVDANGEKQNRKLMNMRRDNHWILDAGQPDMARVRNRVATELWLDMARPPHYYDQAPDVLTGVRGEVVEVFLGSEYRGIYSLTEAMDRKQLQLVKHDTVSNVFHGGLWKTDEFNSQTGFRLTEPFNDSLPDYCSFAVKYPDFEEVFPTSYQVLYDAIHSMEVSEKIETYNRLVDRHFDMPPIIDYTIFYLTLNANDNSARNIYWLCYDRAVDPRLSIAVWDLDASVGQTWSPVDWRPPLTAYNYFKIPYNWLFKMLFHNKCKYRQAFLDRYDELRGSWLSTESLVNRYAAAIDRLIDCGAAVREEQRWNGDSDLYGHPLNFVEEKQYITEWFTNRLPLLDVWMHHHICDVNNDGNVTAADITRLYDCLLFGDEQDYDEHLDTNFDGAITSSDITNVYDVLLGN
ncbi:MAG: CotH kinase family protein [Muribaculaceae bacterium]|nr:CotH kinase family protein [Muribaculaceae bacterium]